MALPALCAQAIEGSRVLGFQVVFTIAAVCGAIATIAVVLFCVYEAGYADGLADAAGMSRSKNGKRRQWVRPLDSQ
jgi:uncharacterized membrane protein